MQTNHKPHHPFLFGHDSRAGIVAIEPAGRFVRLFERDGNGVTFHDLPFSPFILVESPSVLHGCKTPCSIRQLEGNEALRYQLTFDSWSECCAAHDFLEHNVGRQAASKRPYQWFPDIAHQFMITTGITLFNGMEFSGVRVLALDIETWCTAGYEFSNPEREDDRIISIALKGSDGQETLLPGNALSEPEMLSALNAYILQYDPDVITGHNIFRFDLDYIAKRARRYGIPLKWGRNGREAHITHGARWNLAEKSMDYPRMDLYGRHLIDTYFLTLLYDQGTRGLESHGLKAVARHFGLSPEGRTYLDGDSIGRVFLDDPRTLYDYNLDDVRETLSLFNLLAYPWFLQTRMFPYSFQNNPLRGNATRINSLLVREYLHQGHSIPNPHIVATAFEGGYTEQSMQGVYSPVLHCDVASLYPSLMLTYRLGSRQDSLGILLPMLAELREFRLQAKQAARNAATPDEQYYFESLQQVFKVVINSFFGYLGTSIHNFSDPDSASEITRLGRVTIRQMLELLKREGGQPLEVDTDGIYFTPPPECSTLELENRLIAMVSEALPQGIEVEHDGRYRAMFAYKAKNYALLQYDGSIVIKGSSLKSRGMEKYLREFMRDVITLLLNGEGERVEAVYADYISRLRSRTIPVSLVSRTETMNESPAVYREKVRLGKRNRAAAFEIALRSERTYRAGDQVSYYVCGNGKDVTVYECCRPASQFNPAHPDINVPYYLEKLRHVKNRFVPFLPQEPTLF